MEFFEEMVNEFQPAINYFCLKHPSNSISSIALSVLRMVVFWFIIPDKYVIQKVKNQICD